MEFKELCPLVQELIPSLVDRITSAESEKLMREHMEVCEKCRTMYKKMCPAESEVFTVEKEDLSLEKFIRKWKMRKLVSWTVIGALLLSMTGVTVYAIASRKETAFYPGVQFQENVTLLGNGYLLGEKVQPVSISVNGALYHNTFHEDEPDTSFGWDHVSVLLEDGSLLFDNTPYGEASLHQWVPVYDDGSVRSPLVTSHMDDYRQYVFHGALYAQNRLDDFILTNTDKNGNCYIVCYPSSSEEEAVQMVSEYVQTFDLYETDIWQYIISRYPEYSE